MNPEQIKQFEDIATKQAELTEEIKALWNAVPHPKIDVIWDCYSASVDFQVKLSQAQRQLTELNDEIKS